MTDRILGPTGGPRRRRFLLVPVLLAVCTALLYIGNAQAVHDNGVFELDGNAQQGVNSVPPMKNFTSSTEDADNICAAFKQTVSNPSNPAGPKCNQPGATTLPGATNASRASFVTDGSGPFPSGSNDDQWTGGSKDDQNIADWVYKQAASSNDKSDIENAWAAVYNGAHKIIYFGGDRTSNSGSENTAFWFLQQAVAENPNTAGGCTLNSGCPFTGAHTAADPGTDGCLSPQGQTTGIQMTGPNAGGSCNEDPNDSTCPVASRPCSGSMDPGGDVLVVSAFSNGGTQPNTTAYEWVGVGNAPKSLCVTSKCSVIQISNVASGCDPNLSNDPVCAITNQNVQYQSCPGPTGNPPVQPPCVAGNVNPIPSPWIFTEKSSDSATSGASQCTVAANKMCPSIYFEGGLDLTALGLGGECTSSFTMDTRSSASVDSSLQDLAVGQLGSCGSSLSTTPKNGAGDTTAPDDPAGANALSIGTGIVAATDQADVKVTGAGTWNGTLKFFLCGPIAAGDTCDGSPGHVGVQIGTTMNINQGSGTDDGSGGRLILSAAARLTSAANKSTGAPGHYCWRGEVHFTTTGLTDRTDSSSGECFVVNPVTPSLATTAVDCTANHNAISNPVNFGVSVCDKGTLGSTTSTATQPATNGPGDSEGNFKAIFQAANPPIPNGAAAGGKITFTLRGADQPNAQPPVCSTTTASVSAGNASEDKTVSGNNNYFTTGATPSSPGPYHWVAQYVPATGDPNNVGSTYNNDCGDSAEAVVVRLIPTDIRTKQSWFPNDTAVIASTVSGDNIQAGGTVDFFLFNDVSCGTSGGTLVYNERHTIVAGDISSGVATVTTVNYTSGNGTGVPSNPAWAAFAITTALNAGADATTNDFSWKVVYTPASGDTAHEARQSACTPAGANNGVPNGAASIEKFKITYTNDNSGGSKP